ncbi:putative leucine-rich repeat receptor-like serine/threonine-protein kinase At2g19230 [Wolffia australiana]
MSFPKLCRGFQGVVSLFFSFFFFIFFFLILCSAVEAQPGFISLDCGLPEGKDYVEDGTGIKYIPDAKYVDSGEAKTVKASEFAQRYQTLRAFPQGDRNCYNLRPLQVGGRYLVRAELFYGNYDGLQKPPAFDVHVGVHVRVTVSLSLNEIYIQESIAAANGDTIWVCLVNTGTGTPVVSTIQLRQLPDLFYTAANASQTLLVQQRTNYGAAAQVRYPIDRYDRIWFPLSGSLPTINTTMPVKSILNNKFQVPSIVMQTATTVPNVGYSLTIRAATGSPTDTVYVVLYFAELQNLSRSNRSRVMDIFGSGSEIKSLSNYTAPFLTTAYVSVTNAVIGPTSFYNITLRPSITSTLPPMINALESFIIKKIDELPTDFVDVRAIQDIKAAYKLQSNWQGDPCVPKKYSWNGVECAYYDGTKAPRIVSLNLSSSGLTAEIPASIENLTALTTLDVSNNSIPITVTELLAKLPSLKLLNLSGNKITGVSKDLCTKSPADKLSLRIEGLEAVCATSPQPSPSAAKPSPPPSQSGSTSFRPGFHASGAVFVFFLGLLVA